MVLIASDNEFCFIFQVDWRPVVWGIGLQFLLGVIILRWSAGYYFFRFLGDQVKVFLDYTDEGSKFVFGEEGYLQHRMAFKVQQTVQHKAELYFSKVFFFQDGYV